MVREIFSRLPEGTKIDQSHIANAIMFTLKAILPAKDMDIIGPFVREHFRYSKISHMEYSQTEYFGCRPKF